MTQASPNQHDSSKLVIPLFCLWLSQKDCSSSATCVDGREVLINLKYRCPPVWKITQGELQNVWNSNEGNFIFRAKNSTVWPILNEYEMVFPKYYLITFSWFGYICVRGCTLIVPPGYTWASSEEIHLLCTLIRNTVSNMYLGNTSWSYFVWIWHKSHFFSRVSFADLSH